MSNLQPNVIHKIDYLLIINQFPSNLRIMLCCPPFKITGFKIKVLKIVFNSLTKTPVEQMTSIIFQFIRAVFIDNFPRVFDIYSYKIVIFLAQFSNISLEDIRKTFCIFLKHNSEVGTGIISVKLYADIFKTIKSLFEINQTMTCIPAPFLVIISYSDIKHSDTFRIKVADTLCLASPPKGNETPQYICGSQVCVRIMCSYHLFLLLVGLLRCLSI